MVDNESVDDEGRVMIKSLDEVRSRVKAKSEF